MMSWFNASMLSPAAGVADEPAAASLAASGLASGAPLRPSTQFV